MRLTISFELEEKDVPPYCHRVKDTLEKLLKSEEFTNGTIENGGQLKFIYKDGSITPVTISWSRPITSGPRWYGDKYA